MRTITILDNLVIGATTGVGSSVLTDGMKTALTDGIANLTATVDDVLLVIIPAAIVLICINSGANFALGKIRGLLGWAQ